MFAAMRTRLLTVAAAGLILGAVPALAATEHGITPVAPKAGAKVESGSRPTFRGRVRGPGSVWVYVSRSRRTHERGLIAHDAMIQRAKRERGAFRVRARYYDYPQFWLNQPGTYYWQAHRVNCGEDGRDCYQEGPVVKFRVR